MRAVQVSAFGVAEALVLAELDVPEPGPGEVSVDVAYAGVGFVDTLLRAGAFPLQTPFVPGIEVTGHVRAAGEGVDDLRPGQPIAALLNDFGRVQRAGGYAEVAVAHRTMAAPLDADADLARTCAVLANGVAAWMGLHDLARLQPRDRVLVLGSSGGIGATAARLAALAPAAQVIGVVGHDPTRGPDECDAVVEAAELASRLDSLTEDGLVDVVFDPVGGKQRETAFARLAPYGRHVIVGNASGEDPPFSGDALWHETRVVAGLNVGATAHLRPTTVAAALRAVTTLVAREVLREPAPDLVPIEAAASVHRALEERRAPAKTVLTMGAPA